MRKRASKAQLDEWFGRYDHGIALIGGRVSGNFEVLDFDIGGLYEEYAEFAAREGLGDLIESMPLIETPSGGRHLYYRCSEPVTGNQKLAYRLIAIPSEAQFGRKVGREYVTFGGATYPVVAQAGEKYAVTIGVETRGEGGYVLTVPSLAACHPTGKKYKLLRHTPLEVPVITGEQRWRLLELARAFHEHVDPSKVVGATKLSSPRQGGGKRPGDDYNERGDVLALLRRHGWDEV